MTLYLRLGAEVAAALEEGRPLVALESSVVAHGLPRPENLSAADAMLSAVRQEGAVPAMVALIDGHLHVGLSDEEVERLATTDKVAKVGRRDLATTLAARALGATTVSATMIAARLAGIRFFATGGIGGVHRNWQSHPDISSDLAELSRTPVAVIASGAKSILDIPATLEALESLGIPVIGYRTTRFPAFYVANGGVSLNQSAEDSVKLARIAAAQWSLLPEGGLLIANPPPAESALDAATLESLTAQALREAEEKGVAGSAVTPYLLGRLHDLSGGKTRACNVALLLSNARLAAQVAREFNTLEHIS